MRRRTHVLEGEARAIIMESRVFFFMWAQPLQILKSTSFTGNVVFSGEATETMLKAHDNATHSCDENDTSKVGKLVPDPDEGHYEQTNGETPNGEDRGKHHHSTTDLWRAIMNNPSDFITPTVAPRKYIHPEAPHIATGRLVPGDVAAYTEKRGNKDAPLASSNVSTEDLAKGYANIFAIAKPAQETGGGRVDLCCGNAISREKSSTNVCIFGGVCVMLV